MDKTTQTLSLNIDTNEAHEAIRKGADGFTVKVTVLSPSLKGEALSKWLEYIAETVAVVAGSEITRASVDIHSVRLDVGAEAEKIAEAAALAKFKALEGLTPEQQFKAAMGAFKEAKQGAYKQAKERKADKVKALIAEAQAVSA